MLQDFFKKYQKDRSKTYINLYKKLLIILFIFTFINMISLCILYLSAWFLFIIIPLIIMLYFINKMNPNNEMLMNKITSNNYKDYLHRVGRVGRCGNKGIAYSLANYKEEKTVLSYEKKLKIKIPRLYMYDGQISDVKVVKLKFKKKTTKLKVKRKN